MTRPDCVEICVGEAGMDRTETRRIPFAFTSMSTSA